MELLQNRGLYEEGFGARDGSSEAMRRAVLRRGVRTWGFAYGVLTAQERAYLLSLFAGKDTFTFESDEGSCTAYCARGEIRLWNRPQGVYKGMKFNIIEC